MKSTRGERLKLARSRRFRSARAAAASLGVPPATYGAHERAEMSKGRDYGPDEAFRYAGHFQVSPEWLLTGRVQMLVRTHGLELRELREPERIYGATEEPTEIAKHLSALALEAETISLELERTLAVARRANRDQAANRIQSGQVLQTVSRLIDSLDAAVGLIHSLATELDPALRGASDGPSPLEQIARNFSRTARDNAKRGVNKKKN